MAKPNARFLFVFLSLIIKTLILLKLPIVSHAQTLFVFGDGLYDAGNKQYLTDKKVPANSPPYGVTLGKATGRWSDGLIIPDYLAEFMSIPHIPPILDPNADLQYGASFAVADATVLGNPSATMTLAQQVQKFSTNKNKWTEDSRLKAIYLFYIAGDDYLNFIKNNPNPSTQQKQAFVDQINAKIEEALRALYEAGGRKFAFQNLAPLGCLPVVKQEKGSGGECIRLPSEMALLHNQKLVEVLSKLALTLKGFQFSVYDYFSSVQKRVVASKTYTFETANLACCGTGTHHASGCATGNVCSKPVDYLFFDGKHLTQEGNYQTAHVIWGADPNVISPNNLRELLVLPLDVPVVFAGTRFPDKIEDTTVKMHSVYDTGSLGFGLGELAYQIDGIGSLLL